MSSFESLKEQLLKDKKLFEDKDFPPNDASLYGEYPKHPGRDIYWKRPTDISVNPMFIVDGATRTDIDQGKLGNCWFIAAVATLTTCPPKQFQRVVPIDQQFYGDYAGIFHFNFWWYGKWTEVIIDDYLPCDDRGLVYCRNRDQPNEFWVALLEKAYAKLNGSYEELNGGKLQDALMDLTGGIAEIISLKDKGSVPTDLYDTILTAHRMNTVIGGSIHKPRTSTSASSREIRKQNGLYMGHAYSITKLAKVVSGDVTHNLLRVRNPWGMGEWNGAWSDDSTEIKRLSDADKKRLDIQRRRDGEFWIDYGDFLANFDEIQLCHLQPDSMTKELAIDDEKNEWQVSMHHDSWVRGLTAGGCGNAPYQDLYWKNPQYHVKLEQPDPSDGKCTLVVSLIQKYWTKRHHAAIGFDIYKMDAEEPEPLDNERVSRSSLTLWQRPKMYQYYRDMCTRFRVLPGVYTIICSTFEAHKEAEFLLRMYSEKPATSGLTPPEDTQKSGLLNVNQLLQPKTKDVVSQAFHAHCGIDKQVNSHELCAILRQLFDRDLGEESRLNLEQCRSLHVMMDLDKSGYLGLDEVRDMWKNLKIYRSIFATFDKDRSGSVDTFELSKMFRALGLPVNIAVLKTIVRRYGNRDNSLTLEDFIMVVCKITSLFYTYSDLGSKQGNPQGPVSFTLDQWLEHSLFC